MYFTLMSQFYKKEDSLCVFSCSLFLLFKDTVLNLYFELQNAASLYFDKLALNFKQ